MLKRLYNRRFELKRPGINVRTLRAQPRPIPTEEEQDYPLNAPKSGLATPRQLVQYLNEFVIGQENAKKVLSVAVFNHYQRIHANLGPMEREPDGDLDDGRKHSSNIYPAQLHPLRKSSQLPSRSQERPVLFEKSNVLVIGPTGSGKTLLARTLAKVLDVPFSVSDATSFTQAGYVGEDVEMAIQRLVQAANWNPSRARTGIVYIDEVDKIARRTSSGTEGFRDVGGEGVQQALLRMMEGSVVTVQVKAGSSAEIPPSLGDVHVKPGQRPPYPSTPKMESYQIDTTNVLFILSGAFVGLDSIIEQRAKKVSMGFGASFFTPNNQIHRNVLDLVETSDLIKYGFIPEFISRLPSITALAPLTIPDLRRILTDVKGSLVKQYTALFDHTETSILFTDAALDEVCRKAFERGGGARGLRGIMEEVLLKPMFEVPGSDIHHVLISADVVKGNAPPRYWKKGHSEFAKLWAAWAEEQNSLTKKVP